MKKQMMVFLAILLIFSYGCTTPVADDSKKAQGEVEQIEVQDQPTEPKVAEEKTEPQEIVEQVIEEEPSAASPEPVDEEKFKVFNPALTYDGAYNGPLYGTSEQVGSASMDSYFENLDRNGINFFIGMFGISGEPSVDALISDSGLGEVIGAAQKHPHRVIPFFNPGIGGESIEEKNYLKTDLFGWYKNTLAASKKIVGNDFIRGFGEVETQEWNVRHNDPKIMELIGLADANSINFMFHPVASKFSDVVKIIEAYPDTTFLIHMYREDLEKSKTELIKALKEHDNLYFSMDAAHILFVNGNDIIYTYDSENKQSSINKFTSSYDSKEKSLISDAIRAYKPIVDAVPDKVMWGTEIGPEYAFDSKVFDRAVKASRFVIAGFAQEHREAVGYRNALRVFGEGVAADSSIKVLDTDSWTDCTGNQMSGCDSSCEIPDSDALTAEQGFCYQNCLIGERCREVVEMDVG